MISCEKLLPSGGWLLTALVESKPRAGKTERFLHSQRYFGWSKRDCVMVFRQNISDKGWKVVK